MLFSSFTVDILNRAAIHICIPICFFMPLDYALMMIVTQWNHTLYYKTDNKTIKITSIHSIEFSFFRDICWWASVSEYWHMALRAGGFFLEKSFILK